VAPEKIAAAEAETTAAQLPDPASPGFPPKMDWGLQLYAQFSKRLDVLEQKLDLILASIQASPAKALPETPAKS
jgi:hypothetical protein